MRTLHPVSFVAALGAAALLAAAPLAGQAPGGRELLLKIDRNLNPESYESYRKIINIEPNGRKREYTLFTVKDGRDKVAALFLEPAADKGRSTLRLGDNMWLYVPNAGKPVRITSLQSVVGGIFNNADILSLDYASEYDVANVEEQGAEVLLSLKAKSKNVAYDQLRIRADRKRLLPTTIEALTATSMLVKTLHFKDVKDYGQGIVRPAVVETDSPLYKGHTSIMMFARIKGRKFPQEVFTLSFMPNLETIRQ
ncbi:MAG: outer membrane lipoprotein-sorting protein [Vicinamibacteraceae bacterium]|nr:outer membrane lipoprotein-sorting protein [Vicinamibacteraceae bacterium]